LDPAKYRTLFLEEATEHLGEMSGALLCLEKAPGDGEAIDLLFRMVHSVKGMAASLGYNALAELAHHLEDRLGTYRECGAVDTEGLPLLFRGLERLEAMVEHVRQCGDGPASDAELVSALSGVERSEPSEPPPKKARGPLPLR
jgi:two-component system chemotaxis sensor kinase CheA